MKKSLIAALAALLSAVSCVTDGLTPAEDIVQTSISFAAGSSISLYVGDSFTNAATASSGAAVSYESSATGVATVSSDGTVTGVGEGTATITASCGWSGLCTDASASYTVTVTDSSSAGSDTVVEPLDGEITFKSDSLSVEVGATASNVATSNSGAEITYESSDSSIATVDGNGTVTGVSEGTVTITASCGAVTGYTAASGSYTLTVTPKSERAAATVTFSRSSLFLYTGEAESNPATTDSDGKISYESSNPGVATVDSGGTVTAVAAGKAVITASVPATEKYSAASAACSVSVSAPSSGSDGTVDPTNIEDEVARFSPAYTITVTYSSGSATVTGNDDAVVSVKKDGAGVTITNSTPCDINYVLTGSSSDGYFKLYSVRKQEVTLQNLTLANQSGAAINIQSHKRTFVVLSGNSTLKDGKSYTATPDDEDEKAAFFSEGQLCFSGSGSLTVTASGKAAVTSDDYIRFLGGTVTASSSAGHAIRGKDAVIVSDGTVSASSSADKKKGISSDSLVVFNGGATTVKVTGGTAYDNDDADYTGSAGVKADKLFIMNAGTLTISNSGAGGKGINVGSSDSSNDCKAYFNGGTVDITTTGSYYSAGGTSAKGIKVGRKITSGKQTVYTGDMYVRGGSICVRTTGSSSARDSGNEAVESKGVLEVTAGMLYAYSTTDDAINCADDMTLSGGYVCGLSTANDGLDANGNVYIKGAVVQAASASSPEVGIDANSEEQKKLYVQSGVLFVQGGLESGASLTQACYQASSCSTNTWYALTVGSDTYAFKTCSAQGTPLVVSGESQPSLTRGVTVSGGTAIFDGYARIGASASGGSAVTLSSYSGGGGGGGGGGGQGGGPGGH